MSKSLFRIIIVFILVLGAGWLGLWALNESGREIKIKNPDSIKTALDVTEDKFSDFGGKTPEETIKYLVLALEKNNVILAAKYFSLSSRETESEELSRLAKLGFLADIVKSLKNLKNGKLVDDSHFKFESGEGEDALQIILEKNGRGVWKILSL